MKRSYFCAGLVVSVAAIVAFGQSGKLEVSGLEQEIPRLLEASDTPGISIAVIRDGRIAWKGAFGLMNSESGGNVTESTVFEAASLTKPVTAYAAFKLVDRGKLDLDVPLNKYLESDYDTENDRRIDKITARMVLSHTSGFPNWRPRDSKTLPITFEPGEKFRYSGEGFVYLSKVIEKITGREFAEFVRSEVLLPLGMNHSSVKWEPEFLKTKAFNHDSLGIPKGQNEGMEVNAAASLHTTAEDYARFVIAVLRGDGLSEKSRRLMLTPQVTVDKEEAPGLSWGLGWGLEESAEGRSFWHWGDNGLNRSFVIANAGTGNGIVFFTNGANGLSFLDEILRTQSDREFQSAKWIGYERYDSPSRVLFKKAATGDPERAVTGYVDGRSEDRSDWISERQMNRIGYDLMRLGKLDSALVVFRRNTLDHPDSANVWDSLAECYLRKGDKEDALKYYKKAFEMDPENKNAKDQAEKLEKEIGTR